MLAEYGGKAASSENEDDGDSDYVAAASEDARSCTKGDDTDGDVSEGSSCGRGGDGSNRSRAAAGAGNLSDRGAVRPESLGAGGCKQRFSHINTAAAASAPACGPQMAGYAASRPTGPVVHRQPSRPCAPATWDVVVDRQKDRGRMRLRLSDPQCAAVFRPYLDCLQRSALDTLDSGAGSGCGATASHAAGGAEGGGQGQGSPTTHSIPVEVHCQAARPGAATMPLRLQLQLVMRRRCRRGAHQAPRQDIRLQVSLANEFPIDNNAHIH